MERMLYASQLKLPTYNLISSKYTFYPRVSLIEKINDKCTHIPAVVFLSKRDVCMCLKLTSIRLKTGCPCGRTRVTHAPGYSSQLGA